MRERQREKEREKQTETDRERETNRQRERLRMREKKSKREIKRKTGRNIERVTYKKFDLEKRKAETRRVVLWPGFRSPIASLRLNGTFNPLS